jgi:hypothetical protein
MHIKLKWRGTSVNRCNHVCVQLLYEQCTAMFVYSHVCVQLLYEQHGKGAARTWYMVHGRSKYMVQEHMVGARTWSTYMVPGKNMVRGKNMVHGRSSRKGELAGLAGIAANGLR